MSADFIKVVPAEVLRLGVDGAYLLAAVRWVTDIDDEKHGRVRIGDTIWWQASHAGIGAFVGIESHDKVRRIIDRLTAAGELEGLLASTYGRARVYAYRLPPEQQLRESASAATSDYADSRNGATPAASNYADPRNRERESAFAANANPRNPPLYTDLTDLTEGGARAQAQEVALAAQAPPDVAISYLDNIDEPSRYCSRHQPSGTDKKCGRCADARIGWEKYHRDRPEPSATDKKVMALQGLSDPSEIPRAMERVWGQSPEPQELEAPKFVPSERVGESTPYGACDVCGSGLDDNGDCARCNCRSGGWKKRDAGMKGVGS